MQVHTDYPQEQEHEHEHAQIDFDQFYRTYRQPIRRFIASRVNEGEVIDDLTADVFCRTFDYCSRSTEPIRQPRALLYHIARHRIIHFYQERNAKRREIPIIEAPQIAASGSVLAVIDAAAEIQAVQAVLPKIREEYREIITLYAIVGLSVEEIAEMMEKTAVNVRVTLFRARRALKKELHKRYGTNEVDHPKH